MKILTLAFVPEYFEMISTSEIGLTACFLYHDYGVTLMYPTFASHCSSDEFLAGWWRVRGEWYV